MSGRLGVAAPAANTDTDVYTAPEAATVNVLVCNRGAEAVIVNLALVYGTAANLADEDYVEFGVTIPANGVLERTGLVLSANETVVARADKASVSVRVNGYTEA